MGGQLSHRSVVSGRVLACVAAALLVCTARAAAQPGSIALDAVASADADAGSSVRREPGVWFDIFGAVRVWEGLDVVARPVFSRRTFDGAWTKQIYQLGIRYERPIDRAAGRSIGLRIDAGQMPLPIGIAMLENRPDLNPVISQHSAYYLPLPRIDPEIPRTFLIAGTYPFGTQVTVAGQSWDARVAIIDSSPVRGRNMLGANMPPRMTNWITGVGITPHVGVRLGAAFAYGPYVKASEPFVVNKSQGDRIATMAQVEGEWSFRYTRIVGELVRGSMETARATDAITQGGWIEATQTLHPRVFIAGRGDVQAVDYSQANGRPASQEYQRYEAVAGFRVTPDLTLRAGYMTRKGYVVFHWDDQFLVSVTWQRKIY
jgi:hypothetical protein